jgi:dynein heavy chain
MSLFTKTDALSNEEYILKYSLIYLGQRKIAEEKLEKVRTNEENVRHIEEFLNDDGRALFLFALKQPSGLAVSYTTDAHSEKLAGLKDKAVLILRARSPKMANPEDNIELSKENIDREVIFMEIGRNVMDSLYQVCNEVFMPILGNPVNMIGWSELVSKDLMDKFHVFLAYTYVTIGQIKGRTLLPLPANDVTASATTSSKDKAVLLETAIVHWTK